MTQTKKMKMFMKLSEKEHLYDHDKQTAVGEGKTRFIWKLVDVKFMCVYVFMF